MPIFKEGRNGKILRVDFSKAEQKAIDKEIDKQWKELTAEWDKEHHTEICAIVLWVLYEHFGFREKRLKSMFFNFDKYIDEMLEHFSMTDVGDDIWLCTRRLKDAGFDIEAWERELADEKSRKE